MHCQTNQQAKPERVRIKVCGVTSVSDAKMAIEAGVDAVGVNMVAGPRQVDASTAATLVSAIRSASSEVCPVVLARVDGGRLASDAAQVLDQTDARWVQLYGEVTADVIRRLRDREHEAAVVVRVAEPGFARSVNALLAECSHARPAAVVVDAYHRDKLGGTGETFRWSWLTEARERNELVGWPPLVLAGGLTPDNVGRAVREVCPWAVDVSSGVESAPGVKDRARIVDLIGKVRAASG